MKQCPACRAPIQSLMMLDSRNVPEHYCERCARGWPMTATAASKRRQPVAA